MKTKFLSVVFWLSFMLSGTSTGSDEVKPIQAIVITDTSPDSIPSTDVTEMLDDLTGSEQSDQSPHIIIHVHGDLGYSKEFFWLINELQKEKCIKKIIYAGLSETPDQVCQLHPINIPPDNEGLKKAEIKLLSKIHRTTGLPLYGWGQNRLFGKKKESAFKFKYPDDDAVGARLMHIAGIIGWINIMKLMGLFGGNDFESKSTVHTENPLTSLESQFNHDESAAFFSSEPGTLLIMPFLYHASIKCGVPPYLKHMNPDNRVRSILLTRTKQEGIKIAHHFDYWLISSPE